MKDLVAARDVSHAALVCVSDIEAVGSMIVRAAFESAAASGDGLSTAPRESGQ
jgi:hypothetical protein